jgi:transcriptional regulator of acetoin/glycerol metabolism
MSKFSDATYAWMKRSKTRDISSDDLWAALQKSNPELTAVSEKRKTPRTTMMRDLRKDQRFVVGNRRVSLAE